MDKLAYSIEETTKILGLSRDTALERTRNATDAGDRTSAGIFKHVADECSAELEDRLLTIATREVMREGQEADRQARDMLVSAS